MAFTQKPLHRNPVHKTRFLWSKLFGAILILAIVLWQGFEYLYRHNIQLPAQDMAQISLFEIEKGSTLSTIAHNLKNQQFISSAFFFQLYAKRSGLAEKFQAGRFYLSSHLTIPQIAKKLLDAKKREEFLTIPEGLTLQELDTRLAEKGFIPSGEFIKCITQTCNFSNFSFLPENRTNWEGYFFPETYAVIPESFSSQLLAKTMLQEFEKRAKKLGILEKENLNEIVIMASLIEKESRHNDERPIISGILWKRLEQNWTLGVDATVRYFTGKTTEVLTYEDLTADNPYNTRKNTGLPPTAICNPSEASLAAAANPEETKYYYYLHGADGQIHYAVTNDEHNRNKRKYL